MGKIKADWERIRHKYITQGISKSDLAKENKLSVSYLTRKSLKEGWDIEKERFIERTRRESEAKASAAISGLASKLDNATAAVAAKGIAKIQNSLQKDDLLPVEISQLMKAAIDAQRLYKISLGETQSADGQVIINFIPAKSKDDADL